MSHGIILILYIMYLPWLYLGYPEWFPWTCSCVRRSIRKVFWGQICLEEAACTMPPSAFHRVDSHTTGSEKSCCTRLKHGCDPELSEHIWPRGGKSGSRETTSQWYRQKAGDVWKKGDGRRGGQTNRFWNISDAEPTRLAVRKWEETRCPKILGLSS